MKALKNRKAAGLDGVTSEMIRNGVTGCVTGCGDCVINIFFESETVFERSDSFIV